MMMQSGLWKLRLFHPAPGLEIIFLDLWVRDFFCKAPGWKKGKNGKLVLGFLPAPVFRISESLERPKQAPMHHSVFCWLS